MKISPSFPSTSTLAAAILATAIWLDCSSHCLAQTVAPTDTPAPVDGGSTVSYLPLSATVQLSATSGASPTSTPALNSTSRTDTGRTGEGTNATAPAQFLQISSSDLYSPTSLAAQPQATTIVLTYNVACAGAKVLVAPLDGGSINGTPGGQWIIVAADGTLSFSFQAPASAGRHHVVTQMGTSQIAIPFDVAATTNAQPVSPQ